MVKESMNNLNELTMPKFKSSNWDRFKEVPQKLNEMFAHEGKCTICGGPVKMYRDSNTYKLKPSECQCLHCGQYYYMEIENIDAWEKQQWQQKTSRRS